MKAYFSNEDHAKLQAHFDDLLVQDMLKESPILLWLTCMPPELNYKEIVTCLRQHFPELFI